MRSVRIVKEKDGKAKIHKESKSYIFTKDGVYFKLDKEQMNQTKELIENLLNDLLIQAE